MARIETSISATYTSASNGSLIPFEMTRNRSIFVSLPTLTMEVYSVAKARAHTKV